MSFAGIAGGLLAARNSPGAAPDEKARIPIGFLGATHSHGLQKIRVILASPDYELVGVCEEHPATRQACAKLGARIIGREELLEKAAVVAVESNVRDHARHAQQVLAAGKHLHLEKPPAANLEDLRELVALARERRRLLQTGYMWRYHPGFNAIIEAVRKGWLGEVFMVRGSIFNSLPAARRPEWAEFKGGSLFELGSHLIDAVVRLLGAPRQVTSITRKHGNFPDDLKDNNLAVLEYDRALAAISNSSLQAAGSPARCFEVLGTSGSAILQPIEPPELKFDLAKAAGPYKKGVQTVPIAGYQRYEGDFKELAAAVRGQGGLSVTLDQELLVQETLLKACDML